jgi:hypothetical protein
MSNNDHNAENEALGLLARRWFLSRMGAGLGIGSMGLSWLLSQDAACAAPATASTNTLAPRRPHYEPKAKSVIHLFMAGGPSQLELFDAKPKLIELSGQVIPASYIENKRFAFLKKDPKLLGSKRKFHPRGDCGAQISECLPHIGSIADRIAIIRTMATDVFNHGPAKCFLNTGSPRFDRPSMGAWITYGIGSESQDLPGYVVLQSGPRGPRGGTALYSSAFLPTVHQGVPFLPTGNPILNLANPPGVDSRRQRRALDAVRDLNLARLQKTGDSEIATRIAAYEMAFRMQTSAPELIDLSDESEETLALYGVEPDKPSFARNCLLARRLVERGARFVLLFHTDWDHHGGKGVNLENSLDQVCGETDRPSAALVKDLDRRGLLDKTLVVWGGEFGRTPMGEVRETTGRDHHIDAYSMWLAGGGIKGGQTIGKTDELGFNPVEDRVHVHDLQATILHLLGLDHLRLTYRFGGRDFRLTDVAGQVVQKLLA